MTDWTKSIRGITQVLSADGTPLPTRKAIRAGSFITVSDNGSETVISSSVQGGVDTSLDFTWTGLHTFDGGANFNDNEISAAEIDKSDAFTWTAGHVFLGGATFNSNEISAAEIDDSDTFIWSGSHTFAAGAFFTGGASFPNNEIRAAEIDENDTFVWTGSQTFNGALRRDNPVNDPITGTLIDFNGPVGTSIVRLTGATNLTIQGITNGSTGKIITIFDTTASRTVVIEHQAAAAPGADRISTPDATDVTIPQGGSVTLWYDDTSDFWRVLATTAPNSGVQLSDDNTWTGENVFTGNVAEDGVQTEIGQGRFDNHVLDPTTTTIRFTGNGASISGIAPNMNGQVLRLLNVSGAAINILDNDLNSLEANRIRTGGGTKTIPNGMFTNIWYDSIGLRWRCASEISL